MRLLDRHARILLLIAGVMGGCGGRRPLVPGAQATPRRAPAPPTIEPFTPYSPDAAAPAGGGETGGSAGEASASAGSQGGTAGMFASPMPSDGTAGAVAPPPAAAPCDGTPSKPLPYAIATDFSYSFPLNAVQSWSDLTGLDCNQAGFPDVPDGADAGAPPASTDAGAPPGASQAAITSCYAFEYTPDGCVTANGGFDAGVDAGTDVVAACWAGVLLTSSPFLQSTLGICIAPGATAIHFKARASRDGARVKFGAIRAGLGETEFFLEISRAWQDYTIAIPAGEPYDDEATSPFGGVWNGFSIVVEPEDHAGGTYLFVSDVVWSAT